MGSIWLRNMATVFRNNNPLGYPIYEVSGWPTRSRSSGGFEAIRALVMHHTAEGPSADGWVSANFQCFHDADRPNAPIYSSRGLDEPSGRPALYIMAAGACNTQGRGQWGSIPLDDGNRYAFGYEIGCNGIGEPYSPAQQQHIKWVSYVLLTHVFPAYGIRLGAGSICSHFEYAPSRKCDPTGPSAWTTNNNLGCNEADRWEMNIFRMVMAQTLADPSWEDDMALTDDDLKKVATAVWRGAAGKGVNLSSPNWANGAQASPEWWLVESRASIGEPSHRKTDNELDQVRSALADCVTKQEFNLAILRLLAAIEQVVPPGGGLPDGTVEGTLDLGEEKFSGTVTFRPET